MNRIYRLVWNQTLQVMQVASEFAHSRDRAATRGKATSFRRHRLSLACAAAFALGAVTLPAWAVDCTVGGTTYSDCTQGSAGAAGTDASGAGGTNGLNGQTAGNLGNDAGTDGGDGGDSDTTATSGTAGGTATTGTTTVAAGNAIAGGQGGVGGNANGGNGGDGGWAVQYTNANAGNAGSGGNGANAGTGGAGGNAIGGNGFSVENSGSILGGTGGIGGNASGGSGGLGGQGANASGLGGNGGDGGNGGIGGSGGAGGAAVKGSNFQLVNHGVITGGHGGTGGTATLGSAGAGNYGGAPSGTFGSAGIAGNNGAAGAGGAGAAGVVSTGNSSVTTSGHISGGVAGDNVTRANAVEFSGGSNTLTLENGYSFTGNVISSSVGGDTLALGGNTNGSFAVSNLVTTSPTSWAGTAQYYGFTQFTKTGTSTWTLTGDSTAVTPWTINDGTLSVSSDSNLGASSGGLTLNGGTLENTASFTLSHAVTLGNNGGTLQTDAGTNLTVTNAITGTGPLTQNGTGTLILKGDVTTTGASQTYNGSLALGADIALTGTMMTLNDVTGAGNNLSIAGNAALAGALTGANNLSVSGTTSLGGNITTSGTQTYSGAVSLNRDVTLTTTDSALSFANTVSNNVSNRYALSIDTGSGALSFGGSVGTNSFGAQTGLKSLTTYSRTINANAMSTLYIAGNLSITTSDGDIAQRASSTWVADGTAHFDAGAHDITLNQSTNRFTGAISLVGHNVSLRNSLSSGTALGSSTISGTLDVTSNNYSLTQTDALQVTGIATLNAGVGAITLTNASNDFQGNVSATGAGIALVDVNDLTIASLTDNANGNVSLTAGGKLTLPAGGVDAGTGNLTLASNGGSLQSGGTLTGTDIHVIGRDGVALGASVSAGGLLTLASTNSAITQSAGTITTAGTTSVNAGSGTITLAQAGNDFTGATSLIGGATQITDANALTLGTLNTGDLTVDNTGALNLGQGNVAGDLAVASHGGDITQTAALTVTGTSDLQAAAGAINLANATNQFTGAVTTVGQGVKLYATGPLTIASLSSGTDGEVDLQAGGTLTLSAAAIDTGTANLTLISGGTLSMPGTLSGKDVTLGAESDLTLGSDLNSTGALVLTSTGGSIDQSAGSITAASLTGSSVGNTTLTGGNQISTLGAFSASGDFSLTNVSALAISNMLSGANIVLNDSAGILVTGGITATGNTTIGNGTTLQIGDAGTTGSITGDVVDDGTLTFNRSDAVTFADAISGNGALLKQGASTLTLNGDSSAFTGTSTVQDGKLVIGGVAGNGAILGGNVAVNNGGLLGGHGSIGGNVTLANGAHLAPGNSIGTLTIAGDFNAAQSSVLDFELGAPAATPDTFTAFGTGDSVTVGGNLQLDGATLNVADAGTFGPGLYNLFTYAGTLTESNGGVTLGSTPAGAVLQIQRLTAQGQINLLNSTGLTLNFWNGNGLASATQMGGGDGTWSTTAANWTDADGSISAPMDPQPGFAIFGGAAGTVTVDGNSGANPVSALGVQFSSGGYTLTGDTLTLLGSGGAAPIIRVGDGSATGAGYTATINNVLAGTNGLTKADFGTLGLTGSNTYTGKTTISDGTLAITTGGNVTDTVANVENGALLVDGAGSSLTTVGGSLFFVGNGGTGSLTASNGATVHGRGEMEIGRGVGDVGTVTITDGATLNVGTSVNIGQSGTGTLHVSSGGTVNVGAYFSIGNGVGSTGVVTVTGAGSSIVETSAQLAVGTHSAIGTLTVADGATVSAPDIVIGNDGSTGTLNIGAAASDAAVAPGTLISGNGQVRFGSGTGTLVFNHTDGNYTFGSVVDGDGAVDVRAGTTIFTANNSYTAGTTINGGVLSVSSDANLGDVTSGLTLDGGLLQITGTALHATARNITLGSAGGGFNITDAGNAFTLAQALNGSGALTKGGAGTLILTGANSYTGGTTIGAGTLQGDTTSLQGNIANNAALVFNQNTAGTFAGVISGSGSLAKMGNSTLVLDSDSSLFAGTTIVRSGTLIVGNTAASGATLGGDVTVDSGAILGGHGSIGGDVVLAGGAHLAPGNSIGTLTIGGSLNAMQGSVFDFEFGAPGADFATFGAGDSVTVGSNLQLDGATLNVSDASGFGAGLYHLFSYGGTLSENNGGVTLGSTPAGTTLQIQKLTAQKQINLINGASLALDFWNGNGLANATQMGGGDGTWSTTAANWTDAAGSISAPMHPQPGFAIFGGDAGTVTVDGNGGADLVSALGMQFSSGGYTLTGDTLTLLGSDGAAPIIRVGNGGATGAGHTATINNVLAGTDGLTKTDFGTLVLTGANTYTGGTTITAGTLQGDTTSLQGNIVDNAALVFNQNTTGTFAGVISGTGSLAQSGSGVLALTGANTYSGGTTITAGTLQGDTSSLQGNIVNHAALVFQQDAAGTFDGAISGTGTLTKAGTGEMILNTVNPFSGTTHVQAGSLIVGDDGHATANLGGTVTVASGATLGGFGTIGGLDLAGTLAPGHSIGTLHVAGDATIRSGSIYQIEVTPTGQTDQLMVAGKLDIQGGTAMVVAPDGSWAPQTSFTILSAGGGVGGQFDNVSSNLAFLTPTFNYGATEVNLMLERNDISFSQAAQTGNQQATAVAAESLGFGNPLYGALVKLDAPTARTAFDQLSGEIHASTRTAIFDDGRYVRAAINQHQSGVSNGANSRTANRADGVTAWTAGWGHGGDHDGNGNASKLRTTGGGLLVGADLPVGASSQLGAAIGSSQAKARINTLGSSARIRSQHLGLYGSTELGAVQLKAGAIYGWQRVDTDRLVAFGNFSSTASSRYNTHTTQAYADGSYAFAVGHTTLAPFVNVAWQQLDTPTIRENGSAAVNVNRQDNTLTIGTLGLRGVFALGAANSGMHAHASVGWQHAWGDVLPTTTMRFASGGSSFTTAGLPVARSAATISGGINFTVATNVSVDVTYDGQFGSHATDQSARMNLTWQF